MSIYEIAKTCGVSPATVSRVINGKSDVSAATKQRVLAAMEEHSFKPQTVKNLDNAVCLFVSCLDRHDTMISSPYISELVNGMGAELFDRNYILSILPLWRAPQDQEAFKLFCRQHHFAGVVFANLTTQDKAVHWDLRDIPTVFMGVQSAYPQIPTVASADQKGAFDAVEYLVRMGHRRIAHITGDRALPDHCQRLDGYLSALQTHGISPDPRLVFEQLRIGPEDMRIRLGNLMQNPETRPTAFFVCDDFEVIRLQAFLKSLDLQVPDDVSVVGFDDYNFSCFLSPALTTVRRSVCDLGLNAARIVLDTIEKKDITALLETKISAELILRNSVRKLETADEAERSGFYDRP